MVEAQEAPGSRPVEIGRLQRRLKFAGRAAARDGALRLAPSTRPCILDCFVAIEPDYIGSMNAQKPVRSRLKCSRGSTRRFRPTRDRADRRQRAASRPWRLQSRRRKPLQPDDRKPGLCRQEPCRTPADGLCGARRSDGRARPRACRSGPTRRESNDGHVESPFFKPSRRSPTTLAISRCNRTLPARERTMVGPFIFVDEFGPARLPAGQGMDVRPHPHINLATVTYLFEGAIEHRDSIGSHQLIEPGAINLMTAGSGIVHSERSPQRCGRTARASTACRPGSPSRWPRGDRSGVRSCAGDGLPLIEDGDARGACPDGRSVGRDGGDAAAFADHLCGYPARTRAGRSRSKQAPTSGR